jgi:aspartate-semialdehyde dehydrogenase
MKIGVVGATGEVGRMMLTVMAERSLPIDELTLMASSRSAGSKLRYRGEEKEVLPLRKELMQKRYDYLLFSAGSEISERFAPLAEEAGNIVIDNSSAFRQSRPLIVPEINGQLLREYRGIIANPNCSTIQLVLALYPLHLKYRLESLVISTYQSVSGAGNKGIMALQEERNGRKLSDVFPKDIDLNVIPQIGNITADGYCQEELKMHYETGRIMDIRDLKIAVTTVRVPVKNGHAETVFAVFRNRVDLEQAVQIIKGSPYLQYHPEYITPREIGDSDKSHVCRIRRGFDDNSLLFWNVAHNVRLGAATNAVNIMMLMMNTDKEKEKNG